MKICPTLMDYKIMADNDSLYNTGPTYSIYLCGLYFEYRTDDSRLVIENAKAAFANGAILLNYAEAKNFIYNKKINPI
jgi:phosphoserine aminotransferase